MAPRIPLSGWWQTPQDRWNTGIRSFSRDTSSAVTEKAAKQITTAILFPIIGNSFAD
jgi:hypothetical protein